MSKDDNKYFFDGQPLQSLWWDNGANGHQVGSNGVDSIEVAMEPGQMAGVHWAYVKRIDQADVKVNLALCEEVYL